MTRSWHRRQTSGSLFLLLFKLTSCQAPPALEESLASDGWLRRRLGCSWQNWAHKMVCTGSYPHDPASVVPAEITKASVGSGAAPAAVLHPVAHGGPHSWAHPWTAPHLKGTKYHGDMSSVAAWLYKHPPNAAGSATTEFMANNSTDALNDDAGLAALDALFENVNASLGTSEFGVDQINMSSQSALRPLNKDVDEIEIQPACLVNEVALRERPARNPVCYVVPVHEPKFELCKIFLESHARHGLDTDAAIVLSTEASRTSFHHKYLPWSDKPEVRLLVFCGSKRWTAGYETHVVFYKKWWAVMTLGRAYKYYILADAEIFVLQPFRVMNFAQDYFRAKTIYGRNLGHNNKASPMRLHDINKMSSWRITGEENRKKLEAQTENFGIFFWYNEVPIVETETALAYIGALLPGAPPSSKSERGRRILEFDWLSYAYFLVIHHDFKILNADTELSARHHHVPTSYAGRLSLGEDGGGTREFVDLLQPHWTTSCAWVKERGKFNQSLIFLVFHMDRCGYPAEVVNAHRALSSSPRVSSASESRLHVQNFSEPIAVARNAAYSARARSHVRHTHSQVRVRPLATSVTADAGQKEGVKLHSDGDIRQVALWLSQHSAAPEDNPTTTSAAHGEFDSDASVAAIDSLFEFAKNTLMDTDAHSSDKIHHQPHISPSAALKSVCDVQEAALKNLRTSKPVCYVIPCHEPKFDFLSMFLKSHERRGLDTDAAVVFSSESSRMAFSWTYERISILPEVRLLVLCGSPEWQMNVESHPVFYKKWWAVMTLGRAYKYYILADSEVFVVQPFRVLDFAVEWYAAKTIFGRSLLHHTHPEKSVGLTANLREINKVSAWRYQSYSEKSWKKLEVQTNNFSLFFWYNEVPVVETESALAYIGALLPGAPPSSKSEKGRRILEFDWVSYAYFLVVHHDFKILDVDVGLKTRSLGRYDSTGFISKLSLGEDGGGPHAFVDFVQPHWATVCSWIGDRKKFNQSNIFLLFHLDRCAYPPEIANWLGRPTEGSDDDSSSLSGGRNEDADGTTEGLKSSSSSEGVPRAASGVEVKSAAVAKTRRAALKPANWGGLSKAERKVWWKHRGDSDDDSEVGSRDAAESPDQAATETRTAGPKEERSGHPPKPANWGEMTHDDRHEWWDEALKRHKNKDRNNHKGP